MTKDDKRRAVMIGQVIAREDMPNPAAGLRPDRSFEADAQAHAELSRRSRFQSGATSDSPWFEHVMEWFRW